MTTMTYASGVSIAPIANPTQTSKSLADEIVVHVLPVDSVTNLGFVYDPNMDRRSPYRNEPLGYCRSMTTGMSDAGHASSSHLSPCYSQNTGFLVNLQDPLGNCCTFTWSSGLLQSIQNPPNLLTTFLYDRTTAAPLNLLTTISWSSGNYTEFQYSSPPAGGNQSLVLTNVLEYKPAIRDSVRDWEEFSGLQTALTPPPITFPYSSSSEPIYCYRVPCRCRTENSDETHIEAERIGRSLAVHAQTITEAQSRTIMRIAGKSAGDAGISGEDKKDLIAAFMRKMLIFHRDNPTKANRLFCSEAWLYRCAINFARDFARQAQRTRLRETFFGDIPEELSDDLLRDSEEWCSQPDAELLAKELNEWLATALADLNSNERDLLERHSEFGESYAEIAAAVGKSPNAVGKECRRLFARLKLLLKSLNGIQARRKSGNPG